MGVDLQAPATNPRSATLRVGDNMSADVVSIPGEARLFEAARRLAEHRISCVIVLDEDRPVGILSERDLVSQIARDPTGWSGRIVRDVMSHPLHVTETGASVEQAIAQLARHRIRRLPVVSRAGELAGIVTQTDLLRAAYLRLQDYTRHLERLVSERTAELREIERRRDDLVDLTVHDIKNSLYIVDSALDLVGHDPGEAANLLPLVRRATSRMANLVGTLLELNRLESGAMPLRTADVPWATVCEPVLAEVRLMAQARSITVKRTGESHTMVCCDPNLVERILLNLLDNAITVAPEGSAVDVHGEHQGDGSFAIRVGNRGAVILPEILPRLFRKYGRGTDRDSVKRFGGWGLGLTFCRLAVERHGGTIRAVSPYVDGEGAAFEFVLPPHPAS